MSVNVEKVNILSIYRNEIIRMLAADHVIQNTDRFTDTVKNVISLAEYGKLITFGIVPTEAHTG
jgi:mannose-1-phosphate guanylyltransferase